MSGNKNRKNWHKRWVKMYAKVSHSHFGEYMPRRIRRENVWETELP